MKTYREVPQRHPLRNIDAAARNKSPQPTTTHWFGKAVERCQVNDPTFPRVSVHELRHTAVWLLIHSGAHVKTIQRQLGHKTATMTPDRYGHLMDDDLDTVADKMDDKMDDIVEGCAQNVPKGPSFSE